MSDSKAAGPQAILNNLPVLLAGLGLPERLSHLAAAILGICLGSPFDRRPGICRSPVRRAREVPPPTLEEMIRKNDERLEREMAKVLAEIRDFDLPRA
jgi:hypothetical protein